MNLPTHINTCSPPSMNLPAHGTTSPDPSLASLHTSNTHKPLPTALSPSGTPLLPGARPIPDPLFQGLSPGGSHLVARRHAVQGHPCCSYRLAATPVRPSAIPVAYQLLF